MHHVGLSHLMKSPQSCILVALAFVAGLTTLHAETFRFAHIFQSHMVLQREKPVAIWGWAHPGETVSLQFGEHQASAQANHQGRWQIHLPPMPACAEGHELTAHAGNESLSITDVLVGEVWMSAGQSNMARVFQTEKREYADTRIPQAAEADFPQIRFINYDYNASREPLAEMDRQRHDTSRWQVVTPDTIWDSSSLHYFFSKMLHEELNVPIGMVQIARSGSNQVSWMRQADIEASEPGRFEDQTARADAKLQQQGEDGIYSWADFEASVAEWRLDFQPGSAAYQRDWPGAKGPMQRLIHGYPSVLYNSMVHPLAPFTMRGIIWHQGEGGPSENYGTRFPAMVRHWRALYQQNDLTFIWGTLAANLEGTKPEQPVPGDFRSVNEEFLIAEAELHNDNAFLCSFYDLGNGTLHWEAKDIAGQRMARAALVANYGHPGDPTGPILDHIDIDGAAARLHFRYAESGLDIRPSGDISGFILEGADGTFAWADVQAQGNVLRCTHESISQPVNVYYGWDNNPHFTLFNKDGLTSPPFRAHQQ